MTLSSGPFLRMLIIALAVLIGMQILIVGAGYLVRTAELAHPARPRIVEQIAAAATLIEQTPPSDRETAIRAIASPFIAFSLAPTFPADGVGAASRPLPEYQPIISIYREALGQRDFRIYSRRWRRFKGPAPVMPAEVIIIIALRDGSALVVEPAAEYRRQLAVNFAALVSSVVGVFLLAGLVWASFQTTRPLRAMADAAARLASDLDAPAIAERGPGPVRDLARSFNAMKSDLRRLMSERTVAFAAIAHDYRTYLTRLRLRVEGIADVNQRARAIADIEEMSTLIDDTLLFATVQETAPELAVVDIVALGRATCLKLAESGARVTVAPRDAPLYAKANALSIRRALTNLVENAINYGDAAYVAFDRDDGYAVMSVTDDGEGLTAESMQRLSEPFYRLEQSRSRATGGAGLGLAIARMLIEAGGGRLVLSLSPQGGLRVDVFFPAAEAAKDGTGADFARATSNIDAPGAANGPR